MKTLTDKQYLLLNAYYDGEASSWQKWQVERLINKSLEAYEYLSSLEELTARIQAEKESFLSSSKKATNSWETLVGRITDEQRNTLYHGERSLTPSSSNIFTEFLNSIFPSNLSKAFATACLAFVLGVAYKYSSVEVSTNPNLIANANQELVEVPSVSAINSQAQVVSVADRKMQLDWIQSEGRVRLIPTDEQNQQRIIWVMKPRKSIVGQ